MRMIIPHSSPVWPGLTRVRATAVLSVLAMAFGGVQLATAQTHTTTAKSDPEHKPAAKHKTPAAAHSTQMLAKPAHVAATPSAPANKSTPRHKESTATPEESPAPQAAALPAKPPEPEAPVWPANEKPAQAAITWDSQGLRIEAANSSLQQIMEDVATLTGAKVEGLETDERVFGAFGPGQARDVLSQLLQGSGYNVLMIGDQGQGTPRQIVLTARSAAPKTSAANPSPSSEEETDPDEQPQPQYRPPARPFGPGGPRNSQFQPEVRGPHQMPGQPGENQPPQ